MARIRTIKPEFWQHEELSGLPEATHMLAAALLNHADDEGYFRANPGLIKATCCPLREPSVSVHESLISLENIGWIEVTVGTDGKHYGHILKFLEHQVINRPTPSKFKGLWQEYGGSRSPHGALTESSMSEQGTGNREQGREQGVEAAPARPRKKKPATKGTRWESGRTVDSAWLEWARENYPSVDTRRQGTRFANYWVGVPGQRGVKLDWFATWRNWIDKEDQQRRGNGDGRSNSRRKRDTQREAAAELLADTSDDPPTALRDGGQNQGRVEDNP